MPVKWALNMVKVVNFVFMCILQFFLTLGYFTELASMTLLDYSLTYSKL